MDFGRVLKSVRTLVDDYGSGGWGFEFLRACRQTPCTARGFWLCGPERRVSRILIATQLLPNGPLLIEQKFGKPLCRSLLKAR
jgi:hypothetical protein